MLLPLSLVFFVFFNGGQLFCPKSNLLHPFGFRVRSVPLLRPQPVSHPHFLLYFPCARLKPPALAGQLSAHIFPYMNDLFEGCGYARRRCKL